VSIRPPPVRVEGEEAAIAKVTVFVTTNGVLIATHQPEGAFR
jgi:hypothetical protein